MCLLQKMEQYKLILTKLKYGRKDKLVQYISVLPDFLSTLVTSAIIFVKESC